MKGLVAFLALSVAAVSQANPLPEAWAPHERGAEGDGRGFVIETD